MPSGTSEDILKPSVLQGTAADDVVYVSLLNLYGLLANAGTI